MKIKRKISCITFYYTRKRIIILKPELAKNILFYLIMLAVYNFL